MSETAAKPGLVRKLAEVMGEVERIPKSGHNAFHNYDYATEADIVAAVRAGLAKRSVFLTHKVESLAWRSAQTKGGECPVATIHVTFTANDGDTGEVLDLAATVGEGQDAGDKAVYKALTGALKYALLKAFLIPTGDDPEVTEAPQKRQTAKPPPASGAAPKSSGGGPTTFPNYGRAKGEPIKGAHPDNLRFYLKGAQRSLADASKAKFHDKERALLNAIEAELTRQNGGAAGSGGPDDAMGDYGAPPPGDEDAPF